MNTILRKLSRTNKEDRTRKKHKLSNIAIKLSKVKLIVMLITCILAYILACAYSICSYAKKDEKDSAVKVDVIIILGAATANREVLPVFEERLKHGIKLYQDGYAGKMIITGGYGKEQKKSDSSIGRKYAIENSVAAEDIYIEEESTITQENLSEAKKIMDSNNLNKAIIVSDPLHMKRAMLLAKDINIDGYSSPTPTTRYLSFSSKLTFLCREEFFYIGYKVYRHIGIFSICSTIVIAYMVKRCYVKHKIADD